tara:strand:- start:3540 stop:4988 length:1449 start_codon:yes stop_codon:yes gene_type:complete
MFLIKYFDSLSTKNNNIVIFITKLSELNTISLPFKIPLNLKDKSVQFHLDAKKNLEFFHYIKDTKTNYRVIIKQINKTDKNFLSIGSSIYDCFDYKQVKNITFLFSKNVHNKNIIPNVILGYQLKSYNFDKYLSNKKYKPKILYLPKLSIKNLKIINYNINLVNSINLTKDLVSEPANILTPVNYSDRCKKINIKGLKIKILNLDQINKIGMNALVAVAKGSINQPRVVIFEWNLKKNIKPTILVGKGVTFDTGGISIKPSAGMEEMIMDMGGSAVVVGSMVNAALNKSKRSIVGIIGLVENMPDGNAQRPGDIIKSLSGKTIEVLNTDAEGRLVLADLISYIYKKYIPSQILDFATLTGAILVSLGTHRAGIFSNNDSLAKKIELAGEISGERVWRLPLGKEYDNEIDSNRADMKNIGSTRYGGSIQAAQFLKRFINNNTPWAHFDIAGVTWSNNADKNNVNNKGATAFGVRLMDQFLKRK